MAQAQETTVAVTTEAIQSLLDHIKANGGGLLPRIIITSEAGSTVTVSKGQTTITATAITSTTWGCDVPEYGTWTVSSTLDGDTATDEVIVDKLKIYDVEVSHIKIYGVEWDTTASYSPTWSRTDDAVGFVDPASAINNGTGASPFDEILPWSGMQKVEDSDAGTLVSIPKYYYKWTRKGEKIMKLQVSSKYFDGALVSPAHADRGDGNGERDVVYVARYHCASSTYKSTTGVKPHESGSLANFRTYIHNLGSDIWQWDFAMYWTIMMLYLVEFADWNSQAKVGYGVGTQSGVRDNAGATDAMQYHTGTSAANLTTYGHVQYRNIEDLWANVKDWVDGIYFQSSNIYCIKNPASFSDANARILVGQRYTSSAVPSRFTNPSNISGFEYALFPDYSPGWSDYSLCICDGYSYYVNATALAVGGGTANGLTQTAGAFCFDGSLTGSSSIGSRLMKLPNNS